MQKVANQSILKKRSYINGEWLSSSACFEVINPANLAVLADVSEVQAEQVTLAINSANAVQAQWQNRHASERSILLSKWQRLIRENVNDLSRILTLEQGKPLKESKAEILHAADYTQLYSELAETFVTSQSIDAPEGQLGMVAQRPVGVVSAITPWNFPCSMVMRKAAAAIAAGCCVVLKPSELTPLTSLALAALSQQAGIPSGVFNVVVGSNAQAIGEILSQHPKVAKLSFTGSTKIGKKLLAQCALGVTRTSMELGGNAPFIVFDDANIESALEGAIASKFRNAGQTCVSANRFLINKNILQEFQSRLVEKIGMLKIGNGAESGITIGPLINQQAVDKLDQLVVSATTQGAKVVYKASIEHTEGHFYPPTLLENVTPNMSVYEQEIFGPIVAITSFDTEQQAIKLANQTNMGLCCYFYTEDSERQERLCNQLEFGMIGVNQAKLSNPAAPFGGFKQSGMGREGGRYGIQEYLDYQYICRPNSNQTV